MNAEKMVTRVGIAGGAFDPPHNGHLLMAAVALNSGQVDEVWFVPSGRRPDKSYRAGVGDRLELMKLLLRDGMPAGESRIQLCSIELETPTIIGTCELFRALRHRYPHRSFHAIIGSDLVRELPQWRHPEALRQEVPFLVIPRAGGGLHEEDRGFQITWLEGELELGVSSSALRDMLMKGKSVLGMMPGSVMTYMNQRRLYRSPEDG